MRAEPEVVAAVEKALRGEFDFIDIGQLHDDEEWTKIATVAAEAVVKLIDEGYFDD